MNEAHTDRDSDSAAGGNRQTTDRLASVAHETVDRVARSAGNAEQELRERAAQAADKARDSEERVIEAADDGLAQVRTFVQQNPLMSAGIAFAAGVVFTSLLRR